MPEIMPDTIPSPGELVPATAAALIELGNAVSDAVVLTDVYRGEKVATSPEGERTVDMGVGYSMSILRGELNNGEFVVSLSRTRRLATLALLAAEIHGDMSFFDGEDNVYVVGSGKNLLQAAGASPDYLPATRQFTHRLRYRLGGESVRQSVGLAYQPHTRIATPPFAMSVSKPHSMQLRTYEVQAWKQQIAGFRDSITP